MLFTAKIWIQMWNWINLIACWFEGGHSESKPFKRWAAPFCTTTDCAGCLSVVAMLPYKTRKNGVVQHTKAEHGSTLNADFCRILVRRESYYEKSMLWIDLFCIRDWAPLSRKRYCANLQLAHKMLSAVSYYNGIRCKTRRDSACDGQELTVVPH